MLYALQRVNTLMDSRACFGLPNRIECTDSWWLHLNQIIYGLFPGFLAAFVDTCACQLCIFLYVLDAAHMRSIFLLMFTMGFW